MAAAAYRSGSKLVQTKVNPETGEINTIIHDYRHKQGVVYSNIFAPNNAAEWIFDRQKLWQKIEDIELLHNSRLARDFVIPLPVELDLEQNIKLIEEFVRDSLVKRGMVADLNIHYDNPDNPHAHIMTGLRDLVPGNEGEFEFSKYKNRDWDKKAVLLQFRQEIEDIANKHLAMAGIDKEVSSLSYSDRNIRIIPGVSEGKARHIEDSILSARNEQIRIENFKRIRENPKLVIDKLSINSPVFTEDDIANALLEVLKTDLGDKSIRLKYQPKRFTILRSQLRQFFGNKIDAGNSNENKVGNTEQNIDHNSQESANYDNKKVKDDTKKTTTPSKTLSATPSKTSQLPQPSELPELSPKDISLEFAKSFKEVIESEELTTLIKSDLKNRTLYTRTSRFVLEKRYQNVVMQLNESKNHSLGIKVRDLDSMTLGQQLTDKIKEVTTDIGKQVGAEFNFKQRLTLNSEQRAAIVNILNGSDISILEGLPGSGKTTAMKELARQYHKAGYKVIGITKSSSAALELASKTGITAKNADLWRKEWLEANGKKFELPLRSEYYKEELYQNNKPQITDKHVLIIDEASMMGVTVADYFLNEAAKAKAKVIKIGDNNQLAAIGYIPIRLTPILVVTFITQIRDVNFGFTCI